MLATAGTIARYSFTGKGGIEVAMGDEYTATFTLTPAQDYAFAEDFMLDMDNATTVLNDNGTLTVTVTGVVAGVIGDETGVEITLANAVHNDSTITTPAPSLDHTNVTASWSADTATFGQPVTAVLTFEADAGYTFVESLTTEKVTFTGTANKVTNVQVNADRTEMKVWVTATVAEAKIIALKLGLTKPSDSDPLDPTKEVSSSTPATSTVADPTVAWEGATVPEQATSGDDLTVTITVKAADGYVFAEDLETSGVTLSDFSKTSCTVSEDGKTLTYVATVHVD